MPRPSKSPRTVTGHALRDALKRWTFRRDMIGRRFRGARYYFREEKESKEPPDRIMAAYREAEEAIIHLQVAQDRYNLLCTVVVDGQTTSLAEAVAAVGAAVRAERVWKDMVGRASHPYLLPFRDEDGQAPTRSNEPSVETALSFLTDEELADRVFEAGRRLTALRAAVAVANGVEVPVADVGVDADLLDAKPRT